ncbi:N-acetylglucosaminyl deacetylase, LmbE family [Micromonospora pallida]|uniref:N-acetylglucosaminyl deacetylase, LmbE family n=1 Tax=Micromonospora pallida TaxID=145854 RepID=A0A1C6TCP6_9ACTN|nr:PIG-L family deacetylase [Micromonospora pallida]SCL39564.1 N-acetylglucosaminyl deacetylase, LmbE family [Micromonospora pallida]
MPDPDHSAITDIVVSPHFDDGALSAASVLRGGRSVLLVTVCGGSPAEGGDDEWDRLCGFESGPAAAAGRAAEDRAAAALAGNRVTHLPIPDAPYRTDFPSATVVAALAPLFRPDVRVWAPLGIGSHPDHVGTRDAVLTAAAGTGCPVTFYADCPYAFGSGWDAPDQDRPPVDRWQPHLATLAHLVDGTSPRITRLDDPAMRLKIAMLRCHASQLAGLSVDHPHFMAWEGPLRQEVFWPASALIPGLEPTLGSSA